MALLSRLKVWIRGETVKNTDLNAEFGNIINNLKPEYIEDYQSNVTQMRETQTPGTVGAESLATTQAEELKQLRYMIKALSGGAQWYSAPSSTLADIGSAISLPNHRIISGRIDSYSQPMFLTPAGSAASATLKAGTTNLVMNIAGTAYTFTQNTTMTGISLAPGTNNTCLVNNTNYTGQRFTKTLGEGDSVIPVDNVGSEITSVVGQIAAFSKGTEVFLGIYDSTNSVIKQCLRGFFFNSSDTHLDRAALSDNDTITLLKLGYVFATYAASTEGLDITYNQPYVQADTPSSASAGDYWFDIVNSVWKKYSGGTWTSQTAIYVGLVVTDSTNCIAARSTDFTKEFTRSNDVELIRTGANNFQTKAPGGTVSVYGNLVRLTPATGNWVMTSSLDSGESQTASTTYYAYLSPSGDPVLSTIAPHDRRFDLNGFYHPAKPYRCLGAIFNDASSDFVDYATFPVNLAPPAGFGAVNYGLKCSVGAGALTITLTTPSQAEPSAIDPVRAMFGVNYGKGLYKEITQPLSIVIPSGQTIGHPSGYPSWVWVHLALYSNGSVGLAVTGAKYRMPSDGYTHDSTTSYGDLFGTVLNSDAQTITDTAGPMKSKFYRDAPFAVASYVTLGKILSNQATAGTWATLPSFIVTNPIPRTDGSQACIYSNGATNHGSTATKIRRIGNVGAGVEVAGLGVRAFRITDSATEGTRIFIENEGRFAIMAEDSYSAGPVNWGISRNSNALTTDFDGLGESYKLVGCESATNLRSQISWVGYLQAGDILRLQDNGSNDATYVRLWICRLGD